MKQFLKWAVVLLPILWLIGCGGTPEKKDDTVVVEPKPVVEEKIVEEKIVEAPPEENPLLKELKIYFDFDKSDIKPEFKAIIEAHAQNLAKNSNLSLKIEGHCDERGTTEYNMALGERRAASVSKMLTLMGASASQISTVSFGEERPEKEGHDESAWRWNRRAVFVYSE
ncbi:MAG: peptidoglycan-associated lipoprotein Pal [Gammaproteobacteria bacterium]|nr:peptidoglycan-associated lipoprotein Pal [Gammaproteobacteria bacterium]MDH5692177.1 peptidoglycan-associated lipoprotein Pal [Gammaproteobacteria bacterium]